MGFAAPLCLASFSFQGRTACRRFLPRLFVESLNEGLSWNDPAATKLGAGQIAGDDALFGRFFVAAQQRG